MYYTIFPKRLKEAMDEIPMKQVELANKTDIDKSLISNYLAGKYKPKDENLHKLANALGVSVLWLQGYDVSKYETDRLLHDIDKSSLLTKNIINLSKDKLEEELLIKCTMLESDNQKKVLDITNLYLKEQGDYKNE